ncbi:MAG: AAA family ATPase [Pseudomonadota bacterium]
MLRLSDKYIKTWLRSKERKPLVLQGQRQVGKTYFVTHQVAQLLSPPGKVTLVDFFADKHFKDIFINESTPEQILSKLEIHLNTHIDLEHDLLFLDEIQESPHAIESLKYFHEQFPQLKIICAGSFLGIMHNESSFPVGNVEFSSLGILSFSEFLKAFSEEHYLYFSKISPLEHDLIDPYFHKIFLEYFHTYLVTGGMPEVVNTYQRTLPQGQNAALKEARKVQKQILTGYQSDFAKYAGVNNASHILHVFDAIPSQLAQRFDEKTKKFTFSNVIPKNKGFNKIQGPLTWLERSRLAIKASLCNKSEIPLKAYTKENQFKLYMSDGGLLQCALDIPPAAAISGQIGEYKGFIAENFVATHLFLKSFSNLYAWNEGESEIEFLIYYNDAILPIEVKSSAHFLRAKSLDAYVKRYAPSLAIKLSPRNRGYEKNKKILSLPIYLVDRL